MSCDHMALANASIRQLMPYQPGKPISELARELGMAESDIVKLASNENPLGPSKQVEAAISRELPELCRYPDGSGFELKQKLAEYLGASSEQITLGNGSNDVLELIARVFAGPGDEIIFSQYAFVVYPLATKAVGATPVVVPAKDWGHDLAAMAAAITERTKLVFIANPNNPTGTFLTSQQLADFLAKVPPQVLVVLDEAYYEYVAAEERAPSMQWLSQYPNLIVTRTFSKAWGLAGLRVGYAVTQPQVADLLNRLRQPFNSNAIALRAAELVLDDQEYLARSVEVNQQGLAYLQTELAAMQIAFIPSHGNFLTIEVPNAAAIDKQLLQRGVIVRPIAGYGMPDHLRVSIGTADENQRFITELRQILA